MRRQGFVVLALVLAVGTAPCSAAWSPSDYRDEDTLEFLTTDADGSAHWSTVWLVVVEDDVYIRLGSRAAARIESNARAPVVSVRIAGQEFGAVDAISAPEMVEAVAGAMAEKYWSDVFIRWVPHPLTMRLRPREADE